MVRAVSAGYGKITLSNTELGTKSSPFISAPGASLSLYLWANAKTVDVINFKFAATAKAVNSATASIVQAATGLSLAVGEDSTSFTFQETNTAQYLLPIKFNKNSPYQLLLNVSD